MTEGRRLGRYTLLRPIGRGGMGEVWEAVMHGPLGFEKRVAVKLLSSVTGPGAEAALAREARLGALLHHPNVVAVHDVANVDGTWLVAMELVRGTSAADLVRKGPLPAWAVLDLGVQAAAALHHVHTLAVDGVPLRMVHRDVKPGNLLVDVSGLVKLADLGISSAEGADRTRSGTPGYMPPEQAAGGPEDHRVDVHALGATLFVLATGRRPRDARAGPEVRALDVVLPGLADVVGRAIAPDPDARFPTAAALGDSLRACRPAVPGAGLAELVATCRPDLAVAAPTPSRGTTPPLSAGPTIVVAVGNLPAARDRFFGRGAEVEDLVRRIRGGQRVITLLGLGGAGKTRLALQAAATLQHELVGGAWFFDLSEARDAEAVCFVLARELGLALPRVDPAGRVGRALAARGPMVVVLDNLEQVVEAAAPLVDGWVAAASDAAFLCTSRIPLRIAAEHRVPLGPLPTDDGVRLFVDRMPVALPAGDEVVVRGVVQALEGLPLAIELAAARTRVMRVATIRERLGEQLRLIGGGGTDRPERHRSLRAALEGSWELLSPAARHALARLSVFEGGFTLEAADAVLEGWALEVVQELAEASLVRVEDGRFRLLAAVQAFAAERLPASDGARAEALHGAFFAQLGVDEALGALDVHGGVDRWHALALENDNLLAAVRRAVARRDGDVTSRAVFALRALRVRHGSFGRLVALLEEVVAVAGPEHAPRLRRALADALADAGRTGESEALFRALLAEARGAGDVAAEWSVLRRLGAVLRSHGRLTEAVAVLREAEALPPPPVPLEVARLAVSLAGASSELGRIDEALAGYAEALATFRRFGNRAGEGDVLGAIGLALHRSGRLDEARIHYEAALACVRETGSRGSEALMLGNLGNLHQEQGRFGEARAHYRASIASMRELGDSRGAAMHLGNLGNLEFNEGRCEAALRCYDEALALAREVGNRATEGAVLSNLGAALHALGRLDEARETLERALAVNRAVGHAQFVVSTLVAVGALAADDGRPGEARVHYEEAIGLARRVGDRHMEGAVLHRLGALLRDPALVDAAEALLRDVGDPGELALVEVARSAFLDGEEAGAALTRAEALSRRPDVVRAIARARARA